MTAPCYILTLRALFLMRSTLHVLYNICFLFCITYELVHEWLLIPFKVVLLIFMLDDFVLSVSVFVLDAELVLFVFLVAVAVGAITTH